MSALQKYVWLSVSIIAVATGGVGWSLNHEHRQDREKSTKSIPIRLAYHGDFEKLVVDSKLNEVRSIIRPDWTQVTVPRLLHALRLSGRHPLRDIGSNTNRGEYSPTEMLAILTDDRRFREAIFQNTEPLLRSTPYGIRVLSRPDGNHFGGTEMSPHLDVYLAVMAEIGVPLTFPVVAENGHRGTLHDVLNDAIARFSIHQEIEFSAVAFALYFSPQSKWTNRFGQTYCFDDLVERLDQRWSVSSCVGTHVPYALAVLHAVNQETHILTEVSRQKIESRLKRLSIGLEHTQHPNGAWSEDWRDSLGDSLRNPVAERKTFANDLQGSVSITGHHLDWVGLVSSEFRPSVDVVERAVKFLFQSLPELRHVARSIPNAYCPVSHGVQGLYALKPYSPVPLSTKLRENDNSVDRLNDVSFLKTQQR